MNHLQKNYFSILGFDVVRFDITQHEIDTKYYEQQKLYHTDSHHKPNLHISTELNEAYCNLSDPLARAQHIFELNQINVVTGSISLSVFGLMSEPKKNYDISFEQMKEDFKDNDLDSAYQNWCACQYLKRLIKE